MYHNSLLLYLKIIDQQTNNHFKVLDLNFKCLTWYELNKSVNSFQM